MSSITTHVLDTVAGRPAVEVPVTLERRGASEAWELLAEGCTDADGRVRDLTPGDDALLTGLYQLRFDTSAWSAFFPEVVLRFRVTDPHEHYHIPLLLGPFGFTTYRGS